MFWEKTHPIYTQRLNNAVEAGYQAFSNCKFHGPLIYCNCNVCMSDEHAKQLSTLPLKEIPAWLLAEYTNSAHGFDEYVEDQLKYFLPRYFELIAACEPPSDMGLSVIFSKLDEGKWRNHWPQEQVSAFDEFCYAYIEASCQQLEVNNWPAGYSLAFDMSELLTMVVTCKGNLEAALNALKNAKDPGAALHIATLRSEVRWSDTGTPFLDDAFLSNYKVEAEAIAAFLLSDEVSERILNCTHIEGKDYEKYRRTIEIALMGW